MCVWDRLDINVRPLCVSINVDIFYLFLIRLSRYISCIHAASIHSYICYLSLCVLATNLFVCACVHLHGGEHKYLHVLPLFVGVDGYIYLHLVGFFSVYEQIICVFLCVHVHIHPYVYPYLLHLNLHLVLFSVP